MIAEIQSILQIAQVAFDKTKGFAALAEKISDQDKVLEVQQALIVIHAKAIAASLAEAVQANRIRALQAEVAALQAWGADKRRYELKAAASGMYVYALKDGQRREGEASHWLCPDCFANGRKSFIQSEFGAAEAGRGWRWKCNTCFAQFANIEGSYPEST